MNRGFFQYLYSLLFALLTILGLYYGQVEQYMSTGDSSDLDFVADIQIKENRTGDNSFDIFTQQDKIKTYDLSRPYYSKIRALSEIETETDEKVETSSFPELAIFFRKDFWRLMSGFVNRYHDKQNAISLAHSEQLSLSDDDLYIQYRVIRL